jgi:hypothetical protein
MLLPYEKKLGEVTASTKNTIYLVDSSKETFLTVAKTIAGKSIGWRVGITETVLQVKRKI